MTANLGRDGVQEAARKFGLTEIVRRLFAESSRIYYEEITFTPRQRADGRGEFRVRAWIIPGPWALAHPGVTFESYANDRVLAVDWPGPADPAQCPFEVEVTVRAPAGMDITYSGPLD